MGTHETSFPKYEFHVSRQARDTYQFDQSIFSIHGQVILLNFRSAREFADRMNSKRNLILFPEQAVKASDINAMGLIDEILHTLLEHYRKEINPAVMHGAVKRLETTLGSKEIDKLIRHFATEFPATPVYRNEQSLEEYLAGETEGYPHRLILLEELIMLWLSNNNPAFKPHLELFDDENLSKQTVYSKVFPALEAYFAEQPKLDGMNVLDALLAPSRTSPKSLSGQLEYLLRRWGGIVGSHYLLRILGSVDFIKEEHRVVFGVGGGGDPDYTPVKALETMVYEPERFSPDREWMPTLVLLAKNSYVWLDQLSKQYQRQISHLDDIPDDELDRLARLGFTGLWLIGLWERSSASQKIKQMTGNPEAVASAYSLYDYTIANDLGGDEAYYRLRQRAWERGIRMAADMVPNHVGIFSRWVIEHPDWFVSLPYSPFPTYSFNGPDLSDDGRVGIFLEDHYYSKSDAAVVFKRLDRWTGSEQFIYHGNDGTALPWNDTAQLNYLNPDVREGVIQTILHVARKFPVIRFDAAMTLAKKHYQRLWFPEPGSGGDIASRAEFGLTKDQFNAAMPEEFWREVVDRVAQEVPDTLLLAEAFWLMEGYFVRTLGMHRVYNSAFMNMMRDEKNAEFRQVIKNTIEFDPDILKRYVNFMNNPDERTAVDQFGKGDKYFGTAIMMATLPGLPMFGHGQIEGLTEKYGMEYRKAYWEETADGYLVDRHAREISPLLHNRYIFAEINNFLLYDFYTQHGSVDENVFAYSNMARGEKALVIYHNRFADTRGWIKMSAAYAVKSGGDDKILVQRSLGEGLEIDPSPHKFTIYRDMRTGLEYIQNSAGLAQKGLYFELGAYDYHVFLNFQEVEDNSAGHYSKLARMLGARGVPSMSEALQELFLEKVLTPLRELLNAGQIGWLVQNQESAEPEIMAGQRISALDEVYQKALTFFSAVKEFTGGAGDPAELAETLRYECASVLHLPNLATSLESIPAKTANAIQSYLVRTLGDGRQNWALLLIWTFIHNLGEIFPDGATVDKSAAQKQTATWMDEWLLRKISGEALRGLGLEDNQVWRTTALLDLLINHPDWDNLVGAASQRPFSIFENLYQDPGVQRYLSVNRYKEVLWFNEEAFNNLFSALFASRLVSLDADQHLTPAQKEKRFTELWKLVEKLNQALHKSEFQVEKLYTALQGRQVSVKEI